MTNVAQILTINGKSVDGVLGTRTQCGRMEGADESTELWRHPKYCIFYLISSSCPSEAVQECAIGREGIIKKCIFDRTSFLASAALF